MKNNTVGIDPGLHGGIALVRRDGGILTSDIPIYIANKKRWIDVQNLYLLLHSLRNECENVVIEKVHSMPNQGVSSVFKFGKGFGILIGVCTALKFDIRFVSPNVWKKYFGLGKDKKQSVDLANELYNLKIRKSKDGQAEALLIARYGQEKLWN